MKHYYQNSLFKYYSTLIGSIIFWSLLGVIAYQGIYFDFVVPVTIFGVIVTALNIYNIRTSYIVVSEKGIIWYSFGFIFWTRWKYIEKISRRLYGFSVQEGFLVNRLMLRYRKWHLSNLPNPLGYIPRIRSFILLSCFSKNWRDFKLGQQIKLCAPHLFV